MRPMAKQTTNWTVNRTTFWYRATRCGTTRAAGTPMPPNTASMRPAVDCDMPASVRRVGSQANRA